MKPKVKTRFGVPKQTKNETRQPKAFDLSYEPILVPVNEKLAEIEKDARTLAQTARADLRDLGIVRIPRKKTLTTFVPI